MKYLITLCALMVSVQVMAADCSKTSPDKCDQGGCAGLGFTYTALAGGKSSCIDPSLGKSGEAECLKSVQGSRNQVKEVEKGNNTNNANKADIDS